LPLNVPHRLVKRRLLTRDVVAGLPPGGIPPGRINVGRGTVRATPSDRALGPAARQLFRKIALHPRHLRLPPGFLCRPEPLRSRLVAYLCRLVACPGSLLASLLACFLGLLAGPF
jgi:hypothetical protein